MYILLVQVQVQVSKDTLVIRHLDIDVYDLIVRGTCTVEASLGLITDNFQRSLYDTCMHMCRFGGIDALTHWFLAPHSRQLSLSLAFAVQSTTNS